MAEKNQTPKIKAFGKEVSRDKAHQIIVNDWFNAVYGAGDTVALKDLLFDGWKPLDEWSDEELEDYIDGLCPENQIDGASAGCSQ